MSASPHPLPNLDRLRREARKLLASFNAGEEDARSRILSHLRRARKAGPAILQDKPVGLQEAQFVVARETGFESWPQLSGSVQGATGAATPVLVVPDLRDAVDFYTSRFGFNLKWEYGDPPGYAAVSFGDAEIHLAEDPEVTNTGAVWLHMQVDDVDAVYEALKANGVTVEGPPQVRPWGMREIIAVDLNGYRFHIGTSTE